MNTESTNSIQLFINTCQGMTTHFITSSHVHILLMTERRGKLIRIKILASKTKKGRPANSPPVMKILIYEVVRVAANFSQNFNFIVYINIKFYKEKRDRQIDTDRPTKIQRDKETNRETEKQRD